MAIKNSCETASAVKKLAIVILNFNTKDLLRECLESLSSAISHQPSAIIVEIVVVDNGSKDGSIEYIKVLTRNEITVKLVENDHNMGFAAGNNVGVKYAVKNGADYVMVLNSDTIVKDRFWEMMVEFLERNLEVGVIGPKIYFARGFEFHKSRYQKSELGKVIWSAGGLMDWKNIYGSNRGVDEVDCGQYDEVKEVDNVSGCCLMASAKVWGKVGFFDERYFMYYEDADFCERVKKLGYKIYYFPKSKLWHKNAGSSKVGGPLQDYFITRNRLLFGLYWASLKTKFALFRESIKLLFFGRRWQKIGVKDFYFRKFRIGSWK